MSVNFNDPLAAAPDRRKRLAPLVSDATLLREKAVAAGKDEAAAAAKALSGPLDVVLYGTPDAQAEQEFLQAYATLCKEMAPITASSLRASGFKWPSLHKDASSPVGYRLQKEQFNIGRFFHCLFFLVVLIAAAFAMMRTANGDAFLASYDALRCEEEIVARQDQRLSNGSSDAAGQEGRATGLASLRCSKNPEALESAQRRLDEAGQNRAKVSEYLKEVSVSRGKAEQRLIESVNGLCLVRDRNVCAMDRADSPEVARVLLDRAREIFLPLLLGLLGAWCYVLKTMSADIRSQTFAPGSSLQHLVRLLVGALAGIVAGWIITPDAGAASAVPAIALAFLAGYGADLIFASMDRIIASLTSRGPPVAQG